LNVGVTGGTGFVGRSLVEQLAARGDRVRILTRRDDGSDSTLPGIERVRGDLVDPPSELAAFVDGLDVLYHCAGETRDEARMRPTNVDGTRNLLSAATGRIGHWVQLSSVGAYGPRPSELVSEEEPPRPEGEYEVTKTEADLLVSTRAPASGFSFSILRPCKILGVGMRDRSLYSMFALAKRGVFFYIGEPGAILNYVHVSDVTRALLATGTHPNAKGRTYNLARQIPVEAFAIAIARTLGVRPPRLRLPEKPVRALASLTSWIPRNPLTMGRVDGLTSQVIYSSERIVRDLEFRFEVTIEQGLEELAAAWHGESR
jgi:nucleoside-diphosphate-sugar epimerase